MSFICFILCLVHVAPAFDQRAESNSGFSGGGWQSVLCLTRAVGLHGNSKRECLVWVAIPTRVVPKGH